MKLAIIGKGTAGSLALNHFSKYTNFDIECYYDSNIKEQSVGEGSTVVIPTTLENTLDFNYETLKSIDGTIKTGISYENWGNNNYFHSFIPPYVSIHFNSIKLQNYLQKQNKNRINFIDSNVQNLKDIDADYIIDCSGSPNTITNDYYKAKYIPVNSVIVNQVPLTKQHINYTLCIARPYGWIFGIPLLNRISFGYLYNKDINTKEEILKDLELCIAEQGFIMTDTIKQIEFNNYYRKINFDDKIFYNGNASFFLEPMEATSLATVDLINRKIFDVINKNTTSAMENESYKIWFQQIQQVITLHYFAGSNYKTEFWDNAYKLAYSCMKNFKNKNEIIKLFNTKQSIGNYGTWDIHSFQQNILGLGIKDKLLML